MLNYYQKLNEQEVRAYCSCCMQEVEIEETIDCIICKNCGHTKSKDKMNLLSGKEVIKALKKMGKI